MTKCANGFSINKNMRTKMPTVRGLNGTNEIISAFSWDFFSKTIDKYNT